MSKEIEILKSIATGDRGAFRELYTLFSDKVYNTSLSYAQNKHDAEEITQDVFTSIFKNASNYRGDSKVSTWIYRITVNSSLNQIKKNRRFSVVEMGIGKYDRPDFEHPGILLEHKENAKVLFSVIESLVDSQKTAFILSYVEDLPRQEVADIMGISLKAVESLLQRGKKNLRDKLEKSYPHRRKNKK